MELVRAPKASSNRPISIPLVDGAERAYDGDWLSFATRKGLDTDSNNHWIHNQRDLANVPKDLKRIYSPLVWQNPRPGQGFKEGFRVLQAWLFFGLLEQFHRL